MPHSVALLLRASCSIRSRGARSVLANVSKEEISQFVKAENERVLAGMYQGTEEELKQPIRGRKDSPDVLRRRIRMGAAKRGLAEVDYMLGSFADLHLDEMADDQLYELEELLAETDSDLQKWLLGTQPPPRISNMGAWKELMKHVESGAVRESKLQ